MHKDNEDALNADYSERNELLSALNYGGLEQNNEDPFYNIESIDISIPRNGTDK